MILACNAVQKVHVLIRAAAIHTGHDPHLEELVAQTTLPVLNGVLKQTPSR